MALLWDVTTFVLWGVHGVWMIAPMRDLQQSEEAHVATDNLRGLFKEGVMWTI
jgi:hypothetical protein